MPKIKAGLTGARISVQSHLMAFAAGKSRLESKVIHLSDYMGWASAAELNVYSLQ